MGSKGKLMEDGEVEFVNRRPDGGYLLGVPGVGETVAVPAVAVPKTEDEIEQEGMSLLVRLGEVIANVQTPEVDAHYNAISRQYFASGASLGSRSSKKHEEGTDGLCVNDLTRADCE